MGKPLRISRGRKRTPASQPNYRSPTHAISDESRHRKRETTKKGEEPTALPLFTIPSIGALCPQILNVHISPEPHVIGQVPANVIRIVIDHDLIRVPQPPIAERNVRCGNIPVPSVEPEAARAAAPKMPNVTWTKAAGEVTVRPRF